MGFRITAVVFAAIVVAAVPARAQVVVGVNVRGTGLPEPYSGCANTRAFGAGVSAYVGYERGALGVNAEIQSVTSGTACTYDLFVPTPGVTPPYGYSRYGDYNSLTLIAGRVSFSPMKPVVLSAGGGFETKANQPVGMAGVALRFGRKIGIRAGADAQFVRAHYDTYFWNGATTDRIQNGNTWHSAISGYAGVELKLSK